MDTAENRHHPDWYLKDTEAFILAYSITSRSTFHRLEAVYWSRILNLKEIAQYWTEQAREPSTSSSLPNSAINSKELAALARPVVILIGCKSDYTSERQVSRGEGEALAARIGCPYLRLLHGVNVKESIFVLIRLMRHQLEEIKIRRWEEVKGKTKKNEHKSSEPAKTQVVADIGLLHLIYWVIRRQRANDAS